jgi:hypothetical protein
MTATSSQDDKATPAISYNLSEKKQILFNTTDAVILTWCATLNRDRADIVLNGFWILVGVVGILRSGNFLH